MYLILPLDLARRQFGFAQSVVVFLLDRLERLAWAGRLRKYLGRQARHGAQPLNRIHDLYDLLLGKHDGPEHLIFGDLPRESLDHSDGLSSAGYDQVEI